MNNLIQVEPLPSAVVPKTMGFTGCINCKVFKQCGGHPDPIIFKIGCANYASQKPPKDTDDMNPHFPEKFWKLWDDVGGLVDYSVGTLLGMKAKGLPRYVPLLQGRHLRPSKPLAIKVVAISLCDVLASRRGGKYVVKYAKADELRSAYRLSPGTRVILVGVDHDAPLERFWNKHRTQETCHVLAQLGLEVSTPNYSFFTDVPRFQILRNRKRILLAAERLSQAGVRVALHLNANTPSDWAFWTAFLHEHTEVNSVTVEFQTGAMANHAFGQDTFNAVDELLDRVGRPLHVILVGAARFYSQAREHRWNFTVIDSRPFMYTQSRKLLQRGAAGTFSLKPFPTQKGAPLHQLFEANVQAYEKMLKGGSDTPREAIQDDPTQIALLY
jgi:hypothetical protein